MAPDLITTAKQLRAALPVLNQMPFVAVDTETTGLDPHADDLLLFQIGDDTTQFVVDCRKVKLEPLRPLLEGGKPKAAHNAKFDYRFVAARAGIRMENLIDTMLAEKVLRNGIRDGGFSLQETALRRLNVDLPKDERVTFETHAGDFTEAQLDYARRDVQIVYRLVLEQTPAIEAEGLSQTVKVECLAVPAFGDMELNGIHVDVERWRQVVARSEELRKERKGKLDELFAPHADRDLFGAVLVNYDSEEQVKAALKKAGLDLPDVAESTLAATGHPMAEALLQYREQQKVVTTYGESFLQHVHEKTGRVHPNFFQIGAESGRVSCREPNLQNIKGGSEFRECFTAPKGRKIVTADYSGCELRILAEISQDPVFLKTFREGGDLHAIVASRMFETQVSKAENPELRKVAKAINFGLAYGMGPAGLAQQIAKTVDEAQELMDKYFFTYGRIRAALESSAQFAVDNGYSVTLLGRKRYYRLPDDPDSPDGRKQIGRIRRQAKNAPIQGTNADMIKLALARLRKRLYEEKLDALIVNTVHDEIVVECAGKDADQTAAVLEESMVSAGETFVKSVPVIVDVTVADHWAH